VDRRVSPGKGFWGHREFGDIPLKGGAVIECFGIFDEEKISWRMAEWGPKEHY